MTTKPLTRKDFKDAFNQINSWGFSTEPKYIGRFPVTNSLRKMGIDFGQARILLQSAERAHAALMGTIGSKSINSLRKMSWTLGDISLFWTLGDVKNFK